MHFFNFEEHPLILFNYIWSIYSVHRRFLHHLKVTGEPNHNKSYLDPEKKINSKEFSHIVKYFIDLKSLVEVMSFNKCGTIPEIPVVLTKVCFCHLVMCSGENKYLVVIQCFRVVHRGISHKSLVSYFLRIHTDLLCKELYSS